MSDQRKRGTIYCKQRAPITFKSTSEHVDDARETDSFMCSAITKRSCKRGHTRSVGARDTVRAVRGRRAWSCEAHLRTYAPSLASICFRQRVARSSLLDDPLKWRSAARYTCAPFITLTGRSVHPRWEASLRPLRILRAGQLRQLEAGEGTDIGPPEISTRTYPLSLSK